MESHTTAKAAKASTMSFNPSSFLTVRVGPEGSQQDFLLHEGMLCRRSDFFHRALNGNWAEKKDRLVKLPDDDPKIFALYVGLVYTDLLLDCVDWHKMTHTEFQAQILTLVKFYVFADKLQDKQAKNSALQVICTETAACLCADRLPSAETVEFMYKNTPRDSLGRRLMVDLWNDISTTCILKQCEGVCKDFFLILPIHCMLRALRICGMSHSLEVRKHILRRSLDCLAMAKISCPVQYGR